MEATKSITSRNHCPFCKGVELPFGVISCAHFIRSIEKDEVFIGNSETQVVRVGGSSLLYSSVMDKEFWKRVKEIGRLRTKYFSEE